MAGEENGALLRAMHSNIQGLIFQVGELSGHVEKQNGHVDGLLKWQIEVKTVLRTLTVVASASFAISGIAIAVVTGVLP